jgi:hypothetical protein
VIVGHSGVPVRPRRIVIVGQSRLPVRACRVVIDRIDGIRDPSRGGQEESGEEQACVSDAGKQRVNVSAS